MGENTKIEWTDNTWNPWYGCHKISKGCKNCYMFRDMQRTAFNPNIVTKAKSLTFNKPLKWKEPVMVFTCSWSDFWIEEADGWRMDAFKIIEATPHLTYQILTKRPERINSWLKVHNYKLPPNIWLGISAENQKQFNERIQELYFGISDCFKFLSLEPLLENIDLTVGLKYDLKINWIITGGESGAKNKIRKSELDWFRSIRDQCKEFGISYFHKQHGGSTKTNGIWGGRELDGNIYSEIPTQ